MALKLTRDIVVRSKFLTRKNERTGEIISVLAPNGLQIGLSGSDSVTAEFRSYGNSYFYEGLSGSLTQLTDGTSYLVAGSNVTIASASNGAVTISSTGGGGGSSGPSFFSSTTAGSIFTTGSATFVGGASATDAPSDQGTDVFFFVSGSIDSLETANTGSAVFGGDVYASGTTILSGTSHQAIPKNFSALGGGAGGFVFSGIYPNMITLDVTGSGDNAFIELGHMFSDIQYPYALTGSKDAFLYVSGSPGSRGTSVRGTAVFGGDIATSGSIFLLSEDSSADAAPKIVLNRSGSSPADDDLLGQIIFEGSDENGNIHAYARMVSETNDVTAGAEDGALTIKVTREGTERSILKLANNEIAFNDDSRNIDFRYETDDRTKGFFIDAAENQVLFLSGGAGTSVDETQGADVAFYVSGSIGTRTTATRGTMLLGGDLVTSGGMYINVGGNSVGDFRVESDGEDEAIFLDASANTLYINRGATSFITLVKNTSDEVLAIKGAGLVINENGNNSVDTRIETNNKPNALFIDAGTDQVLILSGGAATSANEAVGADVNFYVSGSIASQGTSTRGTTLLGGDIFTSGSLYVSGTGPSATQTSKLSVGCSPTTPAKVALDVEYDFSTHTFENQLADGEGGGTRLRFGSFHSTVNTAGKLCNLTAGSSVWRSYAANNGAQSGSFLAAALDVDGGADEGLVLLRGFLKVPSGLINGTLATGAPLYASNDTAGEYDVDLPSDSDDVVRIVGYCIDTDSSDALVWFDPDKTWVTVS